MPLVTCPACGRAQTVRQEMTGLYVTCESCEGTFRAVKSAAPRPPRGPVVVSDEPAIGARAIGRSILLIAGLVAAIGVVMVVVIWIVRPAPPNPPEPTARREPQRPSPPADGANTPSADDPRLRQQAAAGAAGLLVVVIGLMVIAYVLLVLVAGAWVARDANARGMPGLGWASFYYLFQLIGRFAVLPFAVVPSLLIPLVGLFVLVFAEFVAWVGFGVYLYARRPGRVTRCPNCVQRRLHYLLVCPHCSLTGGPREALER